MYSTVFESSLRRHSPSMREVFAGQFHCVLLWTFVPNLVARRRLVRATCRSMIENSRVQKPFNQDDCATLGTSNIERERQALSIDRQDDPCPHALLGPAGVRVSSSAVANVPSAIDSSRRNRLRSLSRRRSRWQAGCSMPTSFRCWSRRQWVAGAGFRMGNFDKSVLARRTCGISLRQGLGGNRVRAPAEDIGISTNRSAIRNHYSSVTSDFRTVLDPVLLRPREGHHRRVGCMAKNP